jgi:hypothetical protein
MNGEKFDKLQARLANTIESLKWLLSTNQAGLLTFHGL